MEKNLNPLYYLEEAIGGATARRILKSAKKHKIWVGNIADAAYSKGTRKSNALGGRIWAKWAGKVGDKAQGQKDISWSRKHMEQIQKHGSELDRKIASRKPGDFAKQFKKDKAKRLRKEKAQKGKELIDSLLPQYKLAY